MDPSDASEAIGRRGRVIHAARIGLATAVAVVTIASIAVIAGSPAVVDRGDGPGPTHPALPWRIAVLPATDSTASAAEANHWTLVAADEFDGSALDESRWNTYSGPTTAGVGRHDPANLAVSGGLLTITSHGRSTGGLAWAGGRAYGAWEVRARAEPGTGYSPVILLWPDAEDWPLGGEFDLMEIPEGDRRTNHMTLHYGANDDQSTTAQAGDFTTWHDYAVAWNPGSVVGYIDGVEVFRSTVGPQVPQRPMHLAIQQDIGPFGDWVPPIDASTPARVRAEVDWVRIYAPATAG